MKSNKPKEIGKYLVVDPRVCHGKMTFRGTRVPVETVLNRVARGKTIAELLSSWPELSEAAINEAVQLAPRFGKDRNISSLAVHA